MPLAHYLPRQKRQPLRPGVNWLDPITDGLVGLLWVGNGAAAELVCPSYAVGSAGVTYSVSSRGIPGVAGSGGNKGVYSPRKDFAGWNLSDAPLTLAQYGVHTTPGSSRPFAGVYGSSDGFGFWDFYGTRDRVCRAYIGGSARDATGGTWSTSVSVKAFSASSSAIDGYENGVRFGGSTYSTSSTIGYDPTFTRLYLGGSPDASGTSGEYYWMALWRRLLSPTEHYRLGTEPWCLFLPQTIWLPWSAATGIPALSLADLIISGSDGTGEVYLTF